MEPQPGDKHTVERDAYRFVIQQVKVLQGSFWLEFACVCMANYFFTTWLARDILGQVGTGQWLSNDVVWRLKVSSSYFTRLGEMILDTACSQVPSWLSHLSTATAFRCHEWTKACRSWLDDDGNWKAAQLRNTDADRTGALKWAFDHKFWMKHFKICMIFHVICHVKVYPKKRSSHAAGNFSFRGCHRCLLSRWFAKSRGAGRKP